MAATTSTLGQLLGAQIVLSYLWWGSFIYHTTLWGSGQWLVLGDKDFQRWLFFLISQFLLFSKFNNEPISLV